MHFLSKVVVLTVVGLIARSQSSAAESAQLRHAFDASGFLLLGRQFRNGTHVGGRPAQCDPATDASRCALSSMKLDQRTQVYPGGETRCIFSNSGPYSFEVIPGTARDEESGLPKLLFFFQGGGACWDEATTTGKMRACMTSAYAMQDTQGIFERGNRRNNFFDWTVVHVLYCSGDVHAGNVTRPYPDPSGEPVVQAGARNTRAVIDWVKRQPELAKVGRLVVAGASAGAVAAQVWADRLLSEIPHVRAAVVADSFIGVYPQIAPAAHALKTPTLRVRVHSAADGWMGGAPRGEETTSGASASPAFGNGQERNAQAPTLEGALIRNFGACTTELFSGPGADPTLAEACRAQRVSQQQIFAAHMRRWPNATFAVVQPKHDPVERSYFDVIALTSGHTVRSLSASDFLGRVWAIAESYSAFSNYRHYFVNTDKNSPLGGHCQTIWKTFLTTTTEGSRAEVAPGTVGLADWLAAAAEGDPEGGGANLFQGARFPCSGKRETLSKCRGLIGEHECGSYYCDEAFAS
jgi:hypothetical protein